MTQTDEALRQTIIAKSNQYLRDNEALPSSDLAKQIASLEAFKQISDITLDELAWEASQKIRPYTAEPSASKRMKIRAIFMQEPELRAQAEHYGHLQSIEIQFVDRLVHKSYHDMLQSHRLEMSDDDIDLVSAPIIELLQKTIDINHPECSKERTDIMAKEIYDIMARVLDKQLHHKPRSLQTEDETPADFSAMDDIPEGVTEGQKRMMELAEELEALDYDPKEVFALCNEKYANAHPPIMTIEDQQKALNAIAAIDPKTGISLRDVIDDCFRVLEAEHAFMDTSILLKKPQISSASQAGLIGIRASNDNDSVLYEAYAAAKQSLIDIYIETGIFEGQHTAEIEIRNLEKDLEAKLGMNRRSLISPSQ